MEPGPGPVVELEALTKRYGEFVAVDGISLAVAPGEVVALVGPNGAGKTTTLRMLMGVLAPTSGAARVAGLDCFRDRARVMHHVGFVPDDPIFYDYLRGGEVLDFVIDVRGLPRAVARARADELCRALDLEDALGEYAVNYSKGMKKKLALVCALLHAPRLLVLDEPQSGLDPFSMRRLNELVAAAAAAGNAVFYSTHILEHAERLGHRIAILAGGRLVAVGTLAELRALASESASLEEIFFAVAAPSGDSA
jgi:ABC-2 type transport system ATP-binding protein